MKDYLKNYIDTLNEEKIDETQTSPINIDDAKQSVDASRKQEKSILTNQEKYEEPNKEQQVIENKSEEVKEKNKKRKLIKDNADWNVYKERVFIKTLLHQRFNYFLIMYALTILSASMITVKMLQSIILVTGFFILAMLWFNLARVYIELQEIHKTFHKSILQNDILDIIEQKAEEHPTLLNQLPMNSVLAYGVPALCLVSIFCYLAIILFML